MPVRSNLSKEFGSAFDLPTVVALYRLESPVCGCLSYCRHGASKEVYFLASSFPALLWIQLFRSEGAPHTEYQSRHKQQLLLGSESHVCGFYQFHQSRNIVTPGADQSSVKAVVACSKLVSISISGDHC